MVGYAVWDAFRDDPPPDISDLLIEIERPADEDNGLILLEELGKKLEALPDANDEPSIDDLVYANPDGDEVDWELVSLKLDERNPILDQVVDVLDRPTLTTPMLWYAGAKLLGFRRALGLGRLFSARILLSLHQSNGHAAWEDSMLLLQLGHRFQTENTSMVGFFVGIFISAISLESIQDEFLMLAPNAATTRQRTDQLQSFLLSAEQLRRAVLVEFFYMVHTGMAYAEKTARREHGLYAPIFFKKNRSLRLAAIMSREAMENAQKPWRDMRFPRSRFIEDRNTGFINRCGNFGVPVYSHVFERAFRQAATLATTRAALALAGYANEHNGALPDQLDALVPTYIDAVPLDPIDNQPLRYDPAARKVWSIGTNCVDDGGVGNPDNPDERHPKDIVIKIPPVLP